LISALWGRRAYLPTIAILGLYLVWRILVAADVGWHDTSAAFDFEQNYWPAARHVLHGESPFPAAKTAVLATGTAFVYPAPTALLVAPFGLLSVHAAAALFTLVLFVCALASLHLAGVRDRRCYIAVFLWLPVQSAIMTANLSLLLALGAAVVWRYRDRRIVAGLAAGTIIALKPFVWPLLVWLLVTRRYAAAAWTFAAASVLTFGAWAVLGFEGLGDFLPSMRLLTKLEENQSYTPLGVALKLGLDLGPARAVGLLAAAAALGWLVLLGWKRRDDPRSFSLALTACLLCSPIVWLHYYSLLIVAVAVLKPRFGAAWLLPVFAAGPARLAGPSGWALGVVAVMAATLATALSNWSWRGQVLALTRRRAPVRP
jgi:alpha-1,2-mannosyltransferase